MVFSGLFLDFDPCQDSLLFPIVAERSEVSFCPSYNKENGL